MSLNLWRAFLKANVYLLTGRLHFPRARVGKTITMPDGEDYVIFREVYLDPTPSQPKQPGAIFIPHFHVARMSPKANQIFSLLPIPLFVGLPGFRTKLWLLNKQNGDFAGLYQWDTVEDAENYARSQAMRYMTRRSVPGSVSYRVIPRAWWDQERLSGLVRQ